MVDSTTPRAPKRRHVLKIEIQADTWEDLQTALSQIHFDLATHVPGGVHITSGSPAVGYVIDDEFYPEQTHERYFEQSREYVEARWDADETPG